MRSWLLVGVVCVSSIALWGQSGGITIKKITSPIAIDGLPDEVVWQQADKADKFKQYFPSDSGIAKLVTEVKMLYDNNFIYIAAWMYNQEKGPGEYVTPSLRRDFRGNSNDGLTVVFDTFKDRTNAFVFGVNPYGVQREGLVSNGGAGGPSFSLDWDNKWWSNARQEDGYWTVEMAIPFKTLRFKEGLDSWYINFFRIDSHTGERSTWSPIPRNFSITALAFNRELIWDVPLSKPGPNISVIPYIAGGRSKDFEKGTPSSNDLEVGGDAKIALGPALNLDITVNPDFSQVDVDQQVTNLDRFEIFFPERRQFFLENADLFGEFGADRMRPFFSRRIGIAEDTVADENVQNSILYGLRLSGKINNNLRLGLLNMQTNTDESIGLLSTNYTVATFQQKVFSRSNVGMIFVNKQAFQDSIGSEFTLSPDKFNRLIGLDYNLASPDNRWSGKFFYHRSLDDERLDSTFATAMDLSFNNLQWDASLIVQNIGANFNPEVGFARRTNYQRVASTTWYNYYPKSGPVQSHGPGFDFDYFRNQAQGTTDYDVNLMYRIRMNNTSTFDIRFRRDFVLLLDPFDPTNTESLELDAFTSYGNFLIISNYLSDRRKKFSYEFNLRAGGYFNGNRINLSGNFSYRLQPRGVISLDYSINRIRLPKPFADANLVLFGPRFDLTFTKSLFWTTFLQYNSQISNLNINSRLQWRFKPVSDIFLVYTDNYFASAFQNGDLVNIGQPRFRSIVLKMTYWLNL